MKVLCSIEGLLFIPDVIIVGTLLIGQVYLGLAGFTIFGGDEHNAVGCPRTIQRSGRGILQDGKALDVIRIQTCNGIAVQTGDVSTHYRDTINHIQWSG